MTTQVLYRKWRPQTLAEVVGQGPVTQTLLNALAQRRVGHAYLFTGPRGTGKTSTARILAKAINCLGTEGDGEPDNTCEVCREIDQGSFLDLIEIDAASNRGIDEMRDLREKARFAPARARRKTYIIDEVHMLTEPAFNALLKTLEEPPGQVIIILATTEPHRIPLTVASRCQRFDFRRIRPQDAITRLEQISTSEGFQIGAETMDVVVKAASGSLRDAENLLEQLVLATGPTATAEDARELFALSGSGRGQLLTANLLQGDMAAAIRTVNEFDQQGVDLRQVHREVVEELRVLMLVKAGASDALDLGDLELAERKELVASADLGFLRYMLERFASLNVPTGSPPLPLEMAIVAVLLERDRPVTTQPAPREPARQAATPPVREPAPRQAAPARPEPAKASAAPPRPVPETPPEQTAPVQPEPAVASVAPTAPPTAPPPSPEAADDPIPAVNEKSAPPVDSEPESDALSAELSSDPIVAGNIEALKERWSDVVNSLRGFGSNRNLDAILRSSSTPLEIVGDTLIIGFYYSYHKEKVEDPKYKYLVERRIAEFMGKAYNVECRLIEKERPRGHAVRAAMERGARVEGPVEEPVEEEGRVNSSE